MMGRINVSCQDVNFYKSLGMICISQIFGDIQKFTSIAGIFISDPSCTTTICGSKISNSRVRIQVWDAYFRRLTRTVSSKTSSTSAPCTFDRSEDQPRLPSWIGFPLGNSAVQVPLTPPLVRGAGRDFEAGLPEEALPGRREIEPRTEKPANVPYCWSFRKNIFRQRWWPLRACNRTAPRCSARNIGITPSPISCSSSMKCNTPIVSCPGWR